MLNSPMLSIFQHFHAIPLRSPLILLRSKWRFTGFSRRFTPKNPVRLHNPFGQLPRWGAKNVLPLNLIAFPSRGRCPVGADRALVAGKTDEKSGEVRGTCGESRLYFICIKKAAERIAGFTLRLFRWEQGGKRQAGIAYILAAKPPPSFLIPHSSRAFIHNQGEP